MQETKNRSFSFARERHINKKWKAFIKFHEYNFLARIKINIIINKKQQRKKSPYKFLMVFHKNPEERILFILVVNRRNRNLSQKFVKMLHDRICFHRSSTNIKRKQYWNYYFKIDERHSAHLNEIPATF